jgi:hypothetical protein
MGGIGKFTCQVLPCKMQLLMQIGPPLGAIRHIVNDALVSNKFSRATLTSTALEFHLCDDVVGNVHAANYTWRLESKSPDLDFAARKEISCIIAGDFLFVLFGYLFDNCHVTRCPRHLENLLDEVI